MDTNDTKDPNPGAANSAGATARPDKLRVVAVAPTVIGRSGQPVHQLTLICELPEGIADQIHPGMTWDGRDGWCTASGEPVEIRELSTA